jgi:hypothetical protein
MQRSHIPNHQICRHFLLFMFLARFASLGLGDQQSAYSESSLLQHRERSPSSSTLAFDHELVKSLPDAFCSISLRPALRQLQ